MPYTRPGLITQLEVKKFFYRRRYEKFKMSKTEELLTALINNADVENSVPNSRVEQILLCCIKKQSAEDLGPPQSRVEALLQELAAVIEQGGGSGQSESFIEFQSSSEFSLATSNGVGWDGEMEYSNDKSVWFSWVGESITAVSNSGLYTMYLRGSGNTTITTNNEGSAFVITGTDVKCRGNIESLLDHAVVATGGHPNMADGCYARMFSNCTALTTPPALPATTLTSGCYNSMFEGCTALTTPPALPATTLAYGCYMSMFSGCTSLDTLPALPATTLVEQCYNRMFRGCISIILISTANKDYNAPWRIPMTGDVIATGDKSLYIGMIFDECSNIPTINFDTEYYTMFDPVT